MPIYEYRCEFCGIRKELILKPGEQAQPRCARCRKKMRRMISPTAFILKGSGWYVTDYPNQDRKKGMESDKDTGTPVSETAGEKKETPAAEPEAKASEKTSKTPEGKPAAGKKARRRR